MVKFMFDPGHGGHDSGASGNGIVEKDWVLTFSKKVANYLQEDYYDVTIYFTRTSDKFIGLSERANMANDKKVDYFISFHNNSFKGSSNGFETFIYNGSVSSQTVALQNVIHYEMMQFLKQHGVTDRGKKRANFAVIRETNMPAILIENLFLSSKKDAALLKNASFVENFAIATAKAIAKAFGLKEKDKVVEKLNKKLTDAQEKVRQRLMDLKITDGKNPYEPATNLSVWTMINGLIDVVYTDLNKVKQELLAEIRKDQS